IINTELQLADLETVSKAISRVERIAKSGNKEALVELEVFEAMQAHIDQGQPARTLKLTEDQQGLLGTLHLLTMKKVLYIANVDDSDIDERGLLAVVQTIADAEGAEVVTICNKLESEIAELEDDERLEFLNELGVNESGLDRVIKAGYRLLGLQTYFTAGVKEVRAWTVKQQAPAPKAAAVIHTDFERGFIRAEVISYDDYISGQGEAGAKQAGKWRLEGKDYLVQDGDVIHFRFNV
ncbi:MAG: redox-regulated ATPase YchF, partial [Gammaproteobacteria bacterium]|nr:redox-regulated ATPase YchF [Gammaproteobacteria bacterium]